MDLLLEFLFTGEGMTLGELTGTIPLGGLPDRYYAVSSSPLDNHGHWGDGNHDEVGQGGREEKNKRRSLMVAISVINFPTPSLPLLSSSGGGGVRRRRRGGGGWEVWLPPALRPFSCRGWRLPTRDSTPKTVVAAAGQHQ